MKTTNFSLTTKDVLDLLPFTNQNGLNNLCDSGRLKRKKILGKWVYDKKSVNSLKQQIGMDEYVSISETKQMLETNGIKDVFKRFSDKNETLKCKYNRVTNQFPMSVSNLIKYGYLDVDGDITPKMIKKESVVKTIKHFSKGLKQNVSTPSNNSSYSSMKKVG